MVPIKCSISRKPVRHVLGKILDVLCQTDHKSQPWVLGAKAKYFSSKWKPPITFNSLTNQHDLCDLKASVEISLLLNPL